MNDFELWLEFEQFDQTGTEDPENDFFNMLIQMPTGKKYALNVWTFKYFEYARLECEETNKCLGGKYYSAPDLFVTRLDRQHIEEVVSDLLNHNGLKSEWLVTE